VCAVKEIDAPAVISTVLRIKSVPATPAEPSITNVPPEVVIRYHVAVPEATAATGEGNVGLKTPAAAAGANGEDNVNSANLVVAAPPVLGLVPSYIANNAALPAIVVIASSWAFLRLVE
jgi:hypothetical protein